MRTFILAAVMTTPLFAQSLDPRYEPIGTLNGMIGETKLSLTSMYDREKDRSMVKRRDTNGFTTITVSARTVGTDGTPTSPSLTFTIGPLGTGISGVRSDIFYSDATGYYVADADNDNRANLADFEQDDATVTFSVIAELKPVKRGDDGFVADSERANLQFSGSFSGSVTDID